MNSQKNIAVQLFSRSTPSMRDNWEAQKIKFKKRYPKLTHHDLRQDEGKKGAMWDKIKKKIGLNKEELHQLITSG